MDMTGVLTSLDSSQACPYPAQGGRGNPQVGGDMGHLSASTIRLRSRTLPTSPGAMGQRPPNSRATRSRTSV